MSICCLRRNDRERFDTVFTNLAIQEACKHSLRSRYLRLLDEFHGRARRYSISFYVGHTVITFGSLMVPALMSIQYSSNLSTDSQGTLYWLTWVLSLLVTTFNAILVLFKVDKKYYSLHTTLERLRSEGWQYVGLTGRYSGILTHNTQEPTHENQYKYFCHYVEKIKLRQIEDEYYKYEGSSTMAQPTYAQPPVRNGANKANDAIYPPSLSKDIDTLAKNVPQTVTEVMEGLLKASPGTPEPLDSLDSSKDVKNIVVQ